MKQEQYEKWGRIRAKGLAYYIFVDGMLKMGSLFALLTMLFNHLWKNGLGWPKADDLGLTGLILEFVLKAVLFGGIVTLGVWSSKEKKYKEYERNIEQQVATE
jgi:hypothetical protein